MKTKHKIEDIKYPSPLIHMMRWGAASGSIIAILAAILVFDSRPPDMMLKLPVLYLWALVASGIPGMLLGYFEGLILRILLPDETISFTKEIMESKRRNIYLMTGFTTIGLLLPVFFFLSPIFSEVWVIWPYFYFLVPFAAGLIAVLASHQYMIRLHLWSEWRYGYQNEKAKNGQHLEDNSQDEIPYSDDEAHEAASQG